MKKIILLIMSLFIFATSLMSDEQIALKEHFLNKIDKVVSILEQKDIDKVTRDSEIVKSLTPMFDFELMAKLSLGKVWRTLSKTQQQNFIKLYVERMKQSYSSKIDAYSNEKVEITKIKQPKNNRIELVSNLVSKTEKLEILYKFWKPKDTKKDKDNWLIYDVVIIGVSILKTDKAQFREFLQTKTIDDLMIQLAQK